MTEQALPLTRALPQVPTTLLIARLLRLEVSGVMRRVARSLGVRRPVAMTLEQLEIPGSDLAMRATSFARSLEPDFVFHHSVRTYLYGVAVGHHLGLRPDRELLYVASILHDVGLMPEHDGDGDFELQGARVAHELVLEEGLDEVRAALVHESIALHTSAGIAGGREPEIALTHYGAGLDVIGLRREDVADTTHDAIVAAWPREQFKERFSAILDDQAARKPGCYIAAAMKIGFGMKIKRAPFDE